MVIKKMKSIEALQKKGGCVYKTLKGLCNRYRFFERGLYRRRVDAYEER